MRNDFLLRAGRFLYPQRDRPFHLCDPKTEARMNDYVAASPYVLKTQNVGQLTR